MTASALPQSEVTDGMARAVSEQDCEMIRWYYAQGADVNARDGIGMTLLEHAANDGWLFSAEALLELQANPDLTGGPSLFTAMHYAAYRNNDAMISLLLKYGASPDVTDNSGQTALHMAAMSGTLEGVKAMVKAGADILREDNRGHTAAEIAELRAAERLTFAQRPFTDIAEFLNGKMREKSETLRRDWERHKKVEGDLAALRSYQPQRYRIKYAP
jgi:ankyrin repeat protein